MIENLLPGTTYSCIGKIEYFGFNISKNFVDSPTVTIRTKSLTFGIEPKSFGFELKIHRNIEKNWNLIFYYKKNLTHEIVRSSKVETNNLQLSDLDMSTEYKICLSLVGDNCPYIETECQECKFGKTLEEKPFPPTDVKIAQKHLEQIEVTWKPPTRPSGNIKSYNVQLNGNCIQEDKRCFQECSRSEQKKVLSGPNFKEGFFVFKDVKPFWSYTTKISSINSMGEGNSESATINSNPKPVGLQNVTTIDPESKSLTVNITPECPYTGPTIYKIQLFDHKGQKINEANLNYTVLNGERDLKLATFQSLTPAKSFRVCVTILSEPKERNCFDTTTKQIPPEGHPKMTFIKEMEDSILFKIWPEHANQFDHENLTYNFEMVSKCSYAENTSKCSSNCVDESMPIPYTYQSPDHWFYYNFTDLVPKWYYKFRTKV